MLPEGKRAALVVGHPGHELRVYRWLELTSPETCVLTDGSGRTNRSRLESTTRVLEAARARPGVVYGRFTDAEVYDLIRRGDPAPFVAIMETLADRWIAAGIDYVAADAIEGFNPSHDICRYIVNGAVELVGRRTGRLLGNFDFLLDGRPDDCPAELLSRAIALRLDDADLDRKLDAARGYPELTHETDAALARFGRAAFAVELLRPVVDLRQGVDRIDPDPPLYERFGEHQVRAGLYDSVIRYRTHVQPLVHAMWRQAGLDAAVPVTSTTASAATGGVS